MLDHWAPGQNAWIYWDASTYFKAFIDACSKASHSILITGWDIHSETNLAPDWEGSWIPGRWSLNHFLLQLLESKPDLHINLLCWDYAPIYLLEREKLQSIRFGWFSHPRLHFRMDAAHPLGASHHQKFVIVDGALAFVGGLDLTIRRWDTCEHAARHPLRKDPQGQSYGPYHDVQLGISGALVDELVEVFRERWWRATGTTLPEVVRAKETLSGMIDGAYALENVEAQLALTQPAFRDEPACSDIADLYEQLFMQARHQVIMENQYLTSRHIVRVLSQVLQKENGPEVLIILPQTAGGWLEQKTMGLLQGKALYDLKQVDPHERLLVLTPVHKDLKKPRYITVHSKIALIDGQILTVGSANLNNRSMGLDTECNVTLRFQRPNPGLAAHILAHHTQARAVTVLDAMQDGVPLRQVIDTLNQGSPKRQLQDFPIPDNPTLLIDADLVDAEKPSYLEVGMDRWGHVMQVLARRLGFRSPTLMLGIGICLVLLFLAFWYGLAHEAPWDQKRLISFFASTQPDSWWRHAMIPLTFGIGGLLFIPINIMILATAALLPLPQALGHIILGIILNVSLSYMTGHFAGRFIVRRFFGPRVRDILRRVGRGHFLTLVVLRMVPVAPNSLINLTAGVGHVPFWRFLGASLVGMGPGLILLVVFQKSLFRVLEEPHIVSVVILVGLLVLALFLAQWSLRRFSQYGRS